jgi:hypothetical protein
MSSTYSTNLALELIGTGDQAGNWGATNNLNLGTLLEQAISGYVQQAITDGADTPITIPNGASGVARNMSIECTGALTAARNLIVPANKKLYLIYNATSGGKAVTVKVSGLTGVSVPAGKKMFLVSNGTDIVEAVTYFTSLSAGSLTLTTPLPVASGGTGSSTTTSAPASLGVIPAADLPTVGDFLVGVNTSLSVTGASGSGTAATITFATQTYAPFILGQTITISGISPSGYNASANVTAVTTSSVSYENTTTGTYVSGGTVAATVGNLPAAATVSANATASNIWRARYNTLSGSAVTFTTVANAPYIGAVSFVVANAAHTLTNNANLTVQGGLYFATTGASGTGATATITFATQSVAPYVIGQSITVSGVTPAGYNGVYTVTACTTSSVSFASSVTGSQTVAGTVGANYICSAGDILIFTALTTSTFQVSIIKADGTPSVAPGASGSVLTSDGTTWRSVAIPTSGVTSAVAGNGVAVSSATGAVTFSLAVPTTDSIGTYTFGALSGGGIGSYGSNYSNVVTVNYGAQTTASRSGTWRFLGAGIYVNWGCSPLYYIGLFIRVA